MGPAFFMFTGRVGKTSLMARFIHNSFKEDQQATIQAAFMSRQLQIDSQQVAVVSKLHYFYFLAFGYLLVGTRLLNKEDCMLSSVVLLMDTVIAPAAILIMAVRMTACKMGMLG